MVEKTGTSFDDALDGTIGNDTLSGLEGNDILNGFEGDDSLVGGDDNDVLNGNDGEDTLEGNAGEDTLYGDAGTDVLEGGAGADTLFGGSDNDTLRGGDGADILDDRSGYNTIEGDAGNDTIYGTGSIDGGADNDNIRFYYAADGDATIAGGDGDDKIEIERTNAGTAATYTHIFDGGGGNDTLLAESDNRVQFGAAAEDMRGGDGNDIIRSYYLDDTLDGGAGNDSLDGGQDNDSLTGGTGDDTLIGGGGNDTLDGGADDLATGGTGDVATYSGPRGRYAITQDPSIAGAIRVVDLQLSEGEDVVSGVEFLRFSDGDVAVSSLSLGIRIIGDETSETLDGTPFDDVIEGLGGDDTITGSDGINYLRGGEGNDSITSGSGNDRLEGDAGTDVLEGGAGADTLFGGSDNDTLRGGDGADILDDRSGYNTIEGDAGNDTISGRGSIDGGADNDNIRFYYGSGGDTTVSGGTGDDRIEIDRASASGSEIYTHVFDGGEGNDTLLAESDNRVQFGAAAEDMRGGDGNDIIRSYYLDDTLDGGAGNDSLDGGQDNDSLTGGTGDDTLIGGGGNDTLNGGADDDLLIGGGDDDTLDGGSDNLASGGTGDIASFSGESRLYGYVADAADPEIIYVGTLDGDDIDTLSNIEILRFSDVDLEISSLSLGVLIEGTDLGDFLTGTQDNDVIFGGLGNDTLQAFSGPNILIGGVGDDSLLGDLNDVAYFDGDSADFAITEVSGDFLVSDVRGILGTDTVSGIPILRFNDRDVIVGTIPGISRTGTSFDDALDGTIGNDTLSGLEGNDILNGFEGDDSLVGGDDNDVLNGNDGEDTLEGNAGEDTLYGDAGTDVLEGGAGADTLFGGSDNDTLRGGDGADILDDRSGYNTIEGDAGNDTIYGTGSIDGGADNDNIRFYYAADGDATIAGGDGDDKIEIERTNAGTAATYTHIFDGGGGNDTLLAESDNRVQFGAAAEDMRGGDGNDIIRSYYLDDTLDGGAGNDSLDGGQDNDSLTGGTGDDTLIGGGGNDTLDGGADDLATGGTGDVATYSGPRGRYAITQDPSIAGAIRVVDLQLSEGEDVVSGVEFLRFSDGDVAVSSLSLGIRIIGDETSETLDGTPFDDVIEGLGGDDTITGSDGINYLRGGEGNDSITSGSGNDRLEGDAGTDVLEGGAGADTLFGGSDNDTLRGGDGADILDDRSGYNTIEGDAGNDTIYGTGSIDGGADNDNIRFYYAADGDATIAGGDGDDKIEIERTNAGTAATYTHIFDGGGGNDTLLAESDNRVQFGAAAEDMRGGDGNDIIRSYYLDDTLDGGAGNDSLDGGQDNDSLTGGTGDDTLIGGGGNDTLDGGADDLATGGTGDVAVYTGNRDQYSVVGDTTGLTIFDNRLGAADGTDRIENVETISFSDVDANVATDFLGVVLVGTEFDDNGKPGNPPILVGTILNDQIDGLAGADVLLGLQGFDYLVGGSGDDTLQGGKGNDTLLGNADQDTLIGDEQNDTLDGGAGNDSLDGGQDNDSLTGGTGDDTLIGGGGNDTLDGGADDLATGGTGDVATYSGPRGRYAITQDPSIAGAIRVVDLQLSEGEDVVSGVEFLRFSDGDVAVSSLSLGIRIIGDETSETLDGTPFDDVIEGLGGDDTITGYDGINYLRGGEGNDSITSGSGNDRLEGDAGTDVLEGGAGADTLFGGSDNDTVRGGDGADYLEDLSGLNVQEGGAGNDTISGRGSIDGGADNDNIRFYYGSGGDTTVSGGTGDDRIEIDRASASGSEIYTHVFDGGEGNDTLLAESDNRVQFGAAAEDMRGGDGNDIIRSYYLDDTLDGGAGNDSLDGGQDNDSLTGGTGDDTLIGGGGNDTLDGGADDLATGGTGDVAIYTGNRDKYSVVFDAEGISVFDNRLGNPDGTDRLTSIETLIFADQTISTSGTISGLIINGTSFDDNGVPGNPSILFGTEFDDEINGFSGNDILIGDDGADTLNGGFGSDTFQGALGQFAGDVIEDFGAPDRILITDAMLDSRHFQFSPLSGNTVVQIDADLSGTTDVTFSLEGNYAASDFVFGTNGFGGTLVSLLNTGGPSAVGSSITVAPDTSVPLDGINNPNGIFTWSDPDGLQDVISFSITDETVGGGYLIYNEVEITDPEGSTISDIPISEIGNWSFVSGSTGSSDGVSIVVKDSSGDSSALASATVNSSDAPPPPPPPADGPTLQELEYFARVVAYGGGSVDQIFDVGAPVFDDAGNPTGYKIDSAFVLPQGFVAVGLTSSDPLNPVKPVLAIRGSNSGIDWLLANTDPSGIGYEQALEAWDAATPSLQDWLNENSGDGVSITGHSLGGAQAQLITAWATGAGIPVENVVTFNSPGVSAAVLADNIDYSMLESATHHISSGDVVSMAGEAYVDGNVILYDFESFNPLLSAFDIKNHFFVSHTAHWTDQSIYGTNLDQDPSNGPANPVDPASTSGPAGPLPAFFSSSTSLTSLSLSSGGYSYLDARGYFDFDYFGALYNIALAGNLIGSAFGVPLLGSTLAYSLSTRGGTETLRQNAGLVERLLEAIGLNLQAASLAAYDALVAAVDVVSAWSTAAVLAVGNWAIDTWIGVSEFSAAVWNFTKSLPGKFWEAVSSWTSEKWNEVSQWSEEVWSKLSGLAEEAWQATVDGTTAVLKKIGEFPDQLAQLGADAWDAMSEWGEEQWNKVEDWTAETWEKAEDFTAEVWEDSKTAALEFFDFLKDGAIGLINYVDEGFDNFLNTTKGLVFGRDNGNAEIIQASDGTATAGSTVPAILVGNNNDATDTLNGGNEDDSFLPSGGDILNLFKRILPFSSLQTLTASEEESPTILDAGADYIIGSPENLDGVIVNGFATDDAIFVSGATFNQDDLVVTRGSAILDIDADGDGESDATLTLNGAYELGGFLVEATAFGTFITYDGSLGPFTNDDSGLEYTTEADTSFTSGNVLSNDSPFLDEPLSLTSFDASSSVGSVVSNFDGTFDFDPDGAFDYLGQNETASTSFTYEVLDTGTGLTGTATVTIGIVGVNDAPVADDDVAFVYEDAQTLIHVLGNDEDPDQNDTISIVGATASSGATVEIINGQLRYTADADGFDLLATGAKTTDEITYTIEDTSGVQAQATVFVEVEGVGDGATIRGTRKPDVLTGTSGEDFVTANRDDDIVYAGDGADTVSGDRGDDMLFGEGSIDELYGDQGNDTLKGGTGDDILTGGKGNDEFHFNLGDGIDVITDFKEMNDLLVFSAEISSSDLDISETAGGVLVEYSDDDSVLIEDVSLRLLGEDHFVFL